MSGMNPILVSQSVCCIKSKSSRWVLTASAAVAALVMALASAYGASGDGVHLETVQPSPVVEAPVSPR